MARKNKEKKAKSPKQPKTGKGKAGVLYGLVTLLVILVSVVLACTIFFRVEEVTTIGNQRYTDEEILSAASVEVGANLILTPALQIEGRICKALPYVDHVDVQKRFPTTIRLVVAEAQPAAVVMGATMQTTEEGEEVMVETGEQWIIDAKGRLLEKADDDLAAQYTQVMGLQIMDPVQGEQAEVRVESTRRLETLLSLLQALEHRGITDQVTQIDATLSTEISLVYDGRLTAKLLSNTDFERKLQIFQEIVALTGENEYRTINLKTDVVYDSPTF